MSYPIHNPSNPYIIHYFNYPNKLSLKHHTFSLFTFYYTIQNNQFYPIAISKPNSTQLPFYYQLLTHKPFPTLQSLLNHYLPLNPLK